MPRRDTLKTKRKKSRFDEEAGQGPSQQSRPEVEVVEKEEEETLMKRMILYSDGRLSSSPSPQGLVGGWKRTWVSAEDAKKKCQPIQIFKF